TDTRKHSQPTNTTTTPPGKPERGCAARRKPRAIASARLSVPTTNAPALESEIGKGGSRHERGRTREMLDDRLRQRAGRGWLLRRVCRHLARHSRYRYRRRPGKR